MCARRNRRHKYELAGMHVHSDELSRIHTHTHAHAPKLWPLNKFTHVLIRSPHIPQLPAAHHLPFKFSFLIPPHVSLYFQTNERLRRSSLDLSAWFLLGFFFSLLQTWNTAASLSASLSISQPGSQSIHKLPAAGHGCPFTKRIAGREEKKKEKRKRNTQGGISNGREGKKQRRRAECDSWMCLCSSDAGVELRVGLTVVCGSCRTSERVRGREGGRQHCAVEMSHH